MRVVIVGATGNAGTSLIRSFEDDPQVHEVVGIARRIPDTHFPKTTWAAADIRTSDLTSIFRGADAVVHLAWSIQPSRDIEALYNTNVVGSIRVFKAVTEAKVPALIYASSIGAYSPGPKDRLVDESWPTAGIATSFYSRHKAEIEHILNGCEQEHPELRVVRLRPALKFKRESASEQRRLFGGPFLIGSLLRPDRIPVVPDVDRLRFQCVHTHDIGEAYRLATVSDARGAFNIAAEPVLDPETLSTLFGARKVGMSEKSVRRFCELSWRLHLQPTPPGWVDMAFESPLIDTTRARDELGWAPRHSSKEALVELIQGLHDGAGAPTPTLAPKAGGRFRAKEFLTGVGGREGVQPHF
jgi:UDP-glucose 4-epimerase